MKLYWLLAFGIAWLGFIVWIKWIAFQHIHPGVSFGWFLLSGG